MSSRRIKAANKVAPVVDQVPAPAIAPPTRNRWWADLSPWAGPYIQPPIIRELRERAESSPKVKS